MFAYAFSSNMLVDSAGTPLQAAMVAIKLSSRPVADVGSAHPLTLRPGRRWRRPSSSEA